MAGTFGIAVRVLLCDLDGVLVDSTAAVARAWQGWAARHGLDTDAVVAYAHGRRSIEVIQALTPHLDAAAETQVLENGHVDAPGDTVALPGAQRLLASLPSGTWAVVTSGPRRLALSRIAAAGLPQPPVLVTAGDVRHGKPHPEPYLRAAERLGAAPAEALVLEDAPAGITAARAAGMHVIALATTYPVDRLGEADLVVARLDELDVRRDDEGRLVVRRA